MYPPTITRAHRTDHPGQQGSPPTHVDALLILVYSEIGQSQRHECRNEIPQLCISLNLLLDLQKLRDNECVNRHKKSKSQSLQGPFRFCEIYELSAESLISLPSGRAIGQGFADPS
ncbi:hypothetical protein RRG08_051831 [Elysia crispata]|uniref:Uncharacterized protein n=1 Tax=Elysia crispata TaxID=231223 RepID=A0AAE0ZB46_9GAST|nr:hypothetical protein RRG08_051831 [Elysia crispata]